MKEKRQSTNVNTKMTDKLESSDKDFKAAFIKILQQAITNMPETNEKNTKSQQRNRRYKKSKQILELKNKVTKIKNRMMK